MDLFFSHFFLKLKISFQICIFNDSQSQNEIDHCHGIESHSEAKAIKTN